MIIASIQRERGEALRIVKKKDKRYPIDIVLENGRVIKVPCQKYFTNGFLRSHGCSIMAEYLALQFIGIHIWPIYLLRWHKAFTKNEIKSKVTLRGVAEGIEDHGGICEYSASVSEAKIRDALRNGFTVIMEEKNPIHSIFLFHDSGKNYIINYGKVKRVNVTSIVKKATKNATYRGMVITKRKAKT